MKRIKGFKKTYGAGLNTIRPDDARLIAFLEPMPQGQRAAWIRAALLACLDGGSAPAITEQELAELRAELAWLRQNQSAAPAEVQAVSTETGQPVEQPAPSGPALSPVFLAAVKKAARPGLKLNDPLSDEMVRQDLASIAARGRE